MKNSPREVLRRLARLPLVGMIAAPVEDGLDLVRLAGSAARRQTIRRRLDACRTSEDWLAFIRPILPPTQINSEISALLALAATHGVQRIVEIGTAQGGTTFLLGRAIPTTKWLVTVDLLPRHGRVLKHLIGPEREFHAVGGSSTAAATQRKLAALVGGRPLDLLFLDGDHSYEGVRADYLQYSPLVRVGGLIVFHDIVPAAVTGAPTAGHRWVGGVPRFWTEVKTQGARCWEFVENWDQQGFGIGVIEKHEPTRLPGRTT